MCLKRIRKFFEGILPVKSLQGNVALSISITAPAQRIGNKWYKNQFSKSVTMVVPL
jgi:hypothetical protein